MGLFEILVSEGFEDSELTVPFDRAKELGHQRW